MRYRIKFTYSDRFSENSRQECSICADTKEKAVEKCKEFYGLGVDCTYEITSVEEEG